MTNPQNDFTVELVPVKELKIDKAYQRQERCWSVKKGDLDITRPIRASRRPNGDLNVIDGQQRVAECKRRGIDYIWAIVVTFNSTEEEAADFLASNSNDEVSPEDLHKAALRAERTMNLEVEEILNEHGLRSLHQNEPEDCEPFKGISSIIFLYKKGPDHLRDVLDLARELKWGPYGDRPYNFLRGLSGFVDYRDSWLVDNPKKKFRRTKFVKLCQKHGADHFEKSKNVSTGPKSVHYHLCKVYQEVDHDFNRVPSLTKKG